MAEKAGGCPHTVQRYWQEFRTAVVKNDVDRIADLTQFPFVVSAGTLDADRTTKTVRRSEFIKIFPRLLTNDPGVNPQPSTMRDLINENERLTTLFCSPDGGQIRVGDWVFQQIGQNWRFMQAYAEDKIEIDNGKEGVR